MLSQVCDSYMVHALRAHAGWTIRRIARALHIPRTSIHRLSTKARQGKFKVEKRSGRPKIITPPIRQKLVALVTASSHNSRLPFSSLANLIGHRVSQEVIWQAPHEDCSTAEWLGRNLFLPTKSSNADMTSLSVTPTGELSTGEG